MNQIPIHKRVAYAVIYRIFRYLRKAYHNIDLYYLKKRFKRVGKNCNIEWERRIYNPEYISIGDNFYAKYNLRLEAINFYEGEKYNPELIIGSNVNINTDVHIGCMIKIVIGNNVLMASRIYISDHSHGNIDRHTLEVPPALRKLTSKGGVTIEDNVWIGEGVAIMPGVSIGRNSIIGANSVVTKSVPPYSIVAGVPAKVICQL